MKILAIERDNTACNFYRILTPLHKLDEQGHAEVTFVREAQLADPSAVNLALLSDVIVFHRPATETWFNFIKTCRKHGKLIVSDYDDDPFNTSPLNPYYSQVGVEEVMWEWPDGTREWLWSEDMVSPTGNKIFNIERNINHRDMFRLNFKKSDLVSCTTDLLRQEFLKVNKNVAVLPNCIDFDFWPKAPEMVKKEVRIGWQGGSSHYEDLYLIKDIIIDTLKKHPNAKFIYFGDMRFQGLFKDAPQNQIEWHPWVGHATYPYKLALMNLDIGLCPLVDNQFNRNKSAIKWMEYSVMGIATIASNIPPYAPVMENGRDGLLVSDEPGQWKDALSELIGNPEKRKALAKNAYDKVYEHHNIETKARLWAEAYQNIMKGDLQTV